MQVSPKLRKTTNGYIFWCPGCKCAHHVTTDIEPAWHFDGDVNLPTFSPSVRVYRPAEKDRAEETLCHLFLTKGNLLFLSDCKHDLAGQTIPLPDLPSPKEYNFV